MAAAGFFGGHYWFGIHWAIMVLGTITVFLMARQRISLKEGVFLILLLGVGNTLMKGFLFLDWTQVAFAFAVASFGVHLKRTWLS